VAPHGRFYAIRALCRGQTQVEPALLRERELITFSLSLLLSAVFPSIFLHACMQIERVHLLFYIRILLYTPFSITA